MKIFYPTKNNLKVPDNINALKNGLAIMPIPDKVFISLKQFGNNFAKPIVKIGDKVLTGQIIAYSEAKNGVLVHSSISGIVTNISNLEIIDKHYKTSPVIEISSQGIAQEYTKGIKDGDDFDSYFQDIDKLSTEQKLRRVYSAGVIGMGGAGFSSYLKIISIKKYQYFIINAVESEPDICCDSIVIANYHKQCAYGILLIMLLTEINICHLCVKKSKKDNISPIIESFNNLKIKDKSIEIKLLPDYYVIGCEKILIDHISGKKISYGRYASDYGFISFNISTIKAIFDAVVLNMPTISRVITFTGNLAHKHQNYLVKIGTPIYSILKYNNINYDNYSIRLGGIMMGVDTNNINIGINKNTTSLLVNKPKSNDYDACIRCGKCAEVCPIYLLPQQLYWYANAKKVDKTIEYNLLDCIECGCCNYVCPSNIPLVEFFQFAKNLYTKNQQEDNLANLAKDRYDFRNIRLERDKKERQEMLDRKRDLLKKQMANDEIKEKIAKALKNVQQKKESSNDK